MVTLSGLSLALALSASACSEEGPAVPPVASGARLEQGAAGLSTPLYLTAPAADARLFIAEKTGGIRIVKDGVLLEAPFLDLSAKVSADPDRADPASEQVILTAAQPASNHNGGQVAFGPDGFLYLGLGDGGGSGDPQGRGQNLSDLLSSILRIDVRGDPYTVPANNPFVGSPNSRTEIWSYGLRNPWRFSFDRANGDLYIADVGEAQREEIDVATAADDGGRGAGGMLRHRRLSLSRPRHPCPSRPLLLRRFLPGLGQGLSECRRHRDR